MVWADGIVDQDEIDTMKKYAKRFGFSRDHLDDIVNYILESVKEGKSLENVIMEITQ
jgi:uncharacterized tellurite resistance protein B-like protein